MKQTVRKTAKRPIRHRVWLILTCIFFVISETLFGVSLWIDNTFIINFQQLLYTLTSPLDGSDINLVGGCLSVCAPYLLIAALLVFLNVSVDWLRPRIKVDVFLRFRGHKLRFEVLGIVGRSMALFSVLLLVGSLWFTDNCLHIVEYIQLRMNPTTVYEDYYVDPRSVEITAPQQKKNLIYLYMESMETTYASEAVGGCQGINYMPNLTALARENCAFSNSDQLGGFRSYNGTTWTMGALFATSSGIPFAFPVNYNYMSVFESFAPGCTTLGDILEENGYHNMFLCGSDATFAGRRKFFQQHGNYDIFDLKSAWEEEYVPENYHNGFWGFEDEILYRVAKDKLLELAQEEQPFNLTLLTVDTHHIGGYVCDLCEDTYPISTANVVSCADRQAAEFIQWCMEQDFYEDTMIVIIGDHPRMDDNLVERVEYLDRTIYNCFLNCQMPEDTRLTFREFSAMDIFPTVLAALDFDIKGNRLGLGVNLFSNQDTLAEQLGYNNLNLEFAKYSPYFEEHFA